MFPADDRNVHKPQDRLRRPLAIYSQAVDVCGRCMKESLILGHNLNFSSCEIMVGFRKSSHICIC